MPRDMVLDASALLALLQGEEGSGRVAEGIPGAWISAVNLAEVAGKLMEAGVPEAEAHLALARSLTLPVLTADRAWALLDVGVRVEVIR